MSTINNLAKYGMWDYKNIIAPLAAGLPLAVETAIFAKNIYQKPHIIKEKWQSLKDKVIESFTVHKGEERRDTIWRISKNSLLLLSCLSLMAAAAYGSVVLLPIGVSITTAITAIFLIGKLFLNAKEYKKQIVDAFTQKKDEDPVAAKHRIRRNIIKAIAIGVITVAAIGIGIHILSPMISHGFSWSVSLPLQTKGVVFAEYAAVGVLHGAIACYKWKKGNRSEALFHLFAAALSFIFPAFYWNGNMRLHHSFYGLLLMAAPSRTLKMFGTMATFDSALYMLAPLRGYWGTTPWGTPHFHEYDFINIVVDNVPLFAAGYASSMILENINKKIGKSNNS
jgi:hypothetical protein